MDSSSYSSGSSSVIDAAPFGYGYARGDVVEDGDDMTAAGFVSYLAGLEPGPATMALLAGIGPTGLDEGGRCALLEAWRRCEGWVSAATQRVIVAVATPVLPGESAEWLRESVGLSLRVSPMSAEQRIGVAGALTSTFVGTLVALSLGDISYGHAVAIAELCHGVDAERVQRIEARVLPGACGQTVAEFRRSVRRALLKEAPDAVAAAHDVAARKRNVVLYAGEDAMATVALTMPAADAQTLWLAIDSHARLARDQARAGLRSGDLLDGRTIGAWRCDVMVAWANEVLADPSLPTVHGRPVTVQVVIDIATALGLAENPCELIGYGPIPASVGRELAADHEWQRFLVDPADGRLLDIGRRRYRLSQRLSDFIVARDRRCRFPSCTRRATRCDIDHAVPHGAGGETTRENCGCLCRRHHRLKTFGGWLLESFDDGSCRWTSPGGQVFDVPANRYLDTG
jgi:hypothetical protein